MWYLIARSLGFDREAPADERYDEMMELLQWGSEPTYEQSVLNALQMEDEDDDDDKEPFCHQG